ncbi:MAG: hypothetical protein AAF125_19485, partial [Chloroflexota bacterium]
PSATPPDDDDTGDAAMLPVLPGDFGDGGGLRTDLTYYADMPVITGFADVDDNALSGQRLAELIAAVGMAGTVAAGAALQTTVTSSARRKEEEARAAQLAEVERKKAAQRGRVEAVAQAERNKKAAAEVQAYVEADKSDAWYQWRDDVVQYQLRLGAWQKGQAARYNLYRELDRMDANGGGSPVVRAAIEGQISRIGDAMGSDLGAVGGIVNQTNDVIDEAVERHRTAVQQVQQTAATLPPGSTIADLPQDIQDLFWALGNMHYEGETAVTREGDKTLYYTNVTWTDDDGNTWAFQDAERRNLGYYQYLIRTAAAEGDAAALQEHVNAAAAYMGDVLVERVDREIGYVREDVVSGARWAQEAARTSSGDAYHAGYTREQALRDTTQRWSEDAAKRIDDRGGELMTEMAIRGQGGPVISNDDLYNIVSGGWGTVDDLLSLTTLGAALQVPDIADDQKAQAHQELVRHMIDVNRAILNDGPTQTTSGAVAQLVNDQEDEPTEPDTAFYPDGSVADFMALESEAYDNDYTRLRNDYTHELARHFGAPLALSEEEFMASFGHVLRAMTLDELGLLL